MTTEEKEHAWRGKQKIWFFVYYFISMHVLTKYQVMTIGFFHSTA